MKINLNGLKKEETAKVDNKYPVYPDKDGTLAKLMRRVLKLKAAKKSIDGTLKVEESNVKQNVLPFYLSECKKNVPSSVVVRAVGDQEALMIFQNRYSKPNLDAVKNVVGKKFNDLFKDTFDISIDGEVIMKQAGKKSQELIDKLTALFVEYKCQDAITAVESCVPVDNFHTVRHTMLTVEQNLELQNACPLTISIKER